MSAMSVIERPPPSGRYAPRERPLRRANEIPQVAPSDHDPNTNPAIGTVGPQAALSTHVMYPTGGWHAEAWDGWPVEWRAPWYGSDWSGFGYGRQDGDGYWRRVSTVMSCVDLNSRQLASFPPYGVGPGDVPEVLPSWAGNPEPTVYADWSDFIKATVNSIQLHGEAVVYATAFGANGLPARFVALDPNALDIEPDGAGRTLVSVRGGDPLDPSEYVHVRHQVITGRVRGVGPLEWTGRNLVSAGALESYASDIARTGLWAVLKHPGNLDKTQRDDLKASWIEARLGNSAAPAVLSGGVEFDTVQLSPRDMALLDLRIFDEQRIASAFGVPPFLIGLPQAEGLTYSNATSLFDFHWRATLRPMAQSLMAALSRWLLPEGHRAELDRDEYVRPALGERVQAYSTLHGIADDGQPAITTDEIRRAERLGPRTAPTMPMPSTGGTP